MPKIAKKFHDEGLYWLLTDDDVTLLYCLTSRYGYALYYYNYVLDGWLYAGHPGDYGINLYEVEYD